MSMRSRVERRAEANARRTSPLPQVMFAGVLTLEFWRGYGVTMRPYLLFVSGITGLAGLSFAPGVSVLDLALLSLVFFLAYGFGQALTDCFQTDTDSLSSPYRPLVQERIRTRDVLIVSLLGLATGGLVLSLYSHLNIFLAALGIAGLATYTPFKRRWWGGPGYNAWIVSVLFLIGYASGVGHNWFAAWSFPLFFALAAVFFGYANFVLAGYFKDISADRATGYRTLPVVFGLRASSVVSDGLAVLAVAACGATLTLTLADSDLGAEHVPALLFAIAGVMTTAWAQMRLHQVQSEAEAHHAIGAVVSAYILLLSAIVAAQQPLWAPGITLLYLGFAVTMACRPMREQI